MRTLLLLDVSVFGSAAVAFKAWVRAALDRRGEIANEDRGPGGPFFHRVEAPSPIGAGTRLTMRVKRAR